MQSLGKIVQCAPAVGGKIWCLFFCWFRAPSQEHRAFEGYIVRTSIELLFIADFDEFTAFFSQEIAVLDALHSSHIRRLVAQQFPRNCSRKLRKVQKLAEKFVHTTSY